MFGTGKIIEALATIKADTANHKDDLKDMKETFEKHVEKEDKQQIENRNKIEEIHCKVSNMDCPHDDRIQKIEDRYVKIQKDKAKELIADAEQKADEIKEQAKIKADEIKDRAEIDKGVAKDISSLQTRSKYNLLSMAGLWSVLGFALKKIFM